MIRIPNILITALQEIGTSEYPGEPDNPRISEYLSTVNQRSDDEIPWCAAYVNWCLNQNNIEGTLSAAAKSFLAWGYKIHEGVPGAIAVFHRGSQRWMGHVGFYLDHDDNDIYLLGGNQNDKVCIRTYPKSKLAGLRWNAFF